MGGERAGRRQLRWQRERVWMGVRESGGERWRRSAEHYSLSHVEEPKIETTSFSPSLILFPFLHASCAFLSHFTISPTINATLWV